MFIQEYAFENIVSKISAILSRSQCVKKLIWHHIYGRRILYGHSGASLSIK